MRIMFLLVGMALLLRFQTGCYGDRGRDDHVDHRDDHPALIIVPGGGGDDHRDDHHDDHQGDHR